MKKINYAKLTLSAAVILVGSLSTAALSAPTSEGSKGYINNYNRVDFVNNTFTNTLGLTEPLTSMHMVIKDLDRPSDEVIASCNIPDGVENNSQNRLDHSLKYEHSFRAFVYANTAHELEENLVAVFMVSPGRFGVHVESSGKRTLGSFTDEGNFNILDHNPGILAGGKFGQFEPSISIFDRYESKASEGANMYNAMFYKHGTAVHGSDGYVDGNPRSHACVRFRKDESPLNQKLAMAVGGNVRISVRDTEAFRPCYDKDLIKKAKNYANFMEDAKKAFSKPPEQKKYDSMMSGGLY